MDGKHTQEWSAYAHGNNGASWGIGGEDGAEVALVRTTESDARLIAAAPELLAVCKELVADAIALGRDWEEEIEGTWPDLLKTIDNARAAIAKADGGAL